MIPPSKEFLEAIKNDNPVVAIYKYNEEDKSWNSTEFTDIKKGNKFKMIRENGEFVKSSKGEEMEMTAMGDVVLNDNGQPVILINKGE